jgi:DNA recombination protein RmuC
MPMLLIMVSAAASVIACVLIPLKGRDTADLTPLYRALQGGRDELRNILSALQGDMRGTIGTLQNELRGVLVTQQQTLDARLNGQNQALETRLNNVDTKLSNAAKHQTESLWQVAERLRNALAESTTSLNKVLSENMEKMRQGNEAKLEQMRATVDDKLQSTLETRLGEKFKTVSEQPAQVYQGLGKMQNLAEDVGSLQRALTNVKARGGWGEAQLGALLGDFLAPEQYEANVRVIPESSELVEFAIKLPGQGAGTMWLPIDSKFPQEDFDRLQNAQQAGDPDQVERLGKVFERAIKGQAKTIEEKYVQEPYSTGFAIMFLPTEGLFAETVRRPGLCADVQNTYRVMIAGPTTLRALLTSLRVGFKTLAISQHASDVQRLLGAVKTAFAEYSTVWERLGKQLNTAQNTVNDVRRKTNKVHKVLSEVESSALPNGGAQLFALSAPSYEDEAGEEVEASENL